MIIGLISFVYRQLTEIRVPLVPWLRRTLWTPYKLDELTPDEKLIMQMGVINNPVDIAAEMEKNGAKGAAELLRAMPPKQWVNVKRRIAYLRMWFLGGYMYDPLDWEIQRHEQSQRFE